MTLAVGFATDGLGHFEAGAGDAGEFVVPDALGAEVLAEFAGPGAAAGGVADLFEGGAVAGPVVLAASAEAVDGAEFTIGAEAFEFSFFAVFAGSAGDKELAAGSDDAGALLALAAGVDVTVASVLAGFAGVADRSAAGSDFFSPAVLADASDMVMVAT